MTHKVPETDGCSPSNWRQSLRNAMAHRRFKALRGCEETTHNGISQSVLPTDTDAIADQHRTDWVEEWRLTGM
jgi:hypothetical protein